MLSERVVRAAPAALQQLFGFSETYGFLHIFDATAVPPDGTLPAIALPIWGFGSPFALPTNPVQFDETPPQPAGAPEHGQHTEEILLDVGLSWDDIARHKQQGDIL